MNIFQWLISELAPIRALLKLRPTAELALILVLFKSTGLHPFLALDRCSPSLRWKLKIFTALRHCKLEPEHVVNHRAKQTNKAQHICQICIEFEEESSEKKESSDAIIWMKILWCLPMTNLVPSEAELPMVGTTSIRYPSWGEGNELLDLFLGVALGLPKIEQAPSDSFSECSFGRITAKWSWVDWL